MNLIYGTDDAQEIVQQKTGSAQVRALASSVRGRVEMDEKECRKMCKSIGLEYLPGYEQRVLQYKITDATKDRYGDKVLAKGGELDNYRKNPVVQFAHDYGKLPVGNSLQTKYDRQADAMFALPLFFDDRMDTSGVSDLVFRFASSGAMKACSIGFVPMEYTIPQNDEEREKLGLGRYGILFTKWELIEFSPVPVPANPNALQDDVSGELRKSLTSGLFTAKDVKTLLRYPVFADDTLDAFVKELGDTVIVTNDFVSRAVNAIQKSKKPEPQQEPEPEPVPAPEPQQGAGIDEMRGLVGELKALVSEIKEAVSNVSDQIQNTQSEVEKMQTDLSAVIASAGRQQTADQRKEKSELYRTILGV